MSPYGRILLSSFFLSLSLTIQNISAEESATDYCSALMKQVGREAELANTDVYEMARLERHSFRELLRPGDDNLAVKYPWIVMSAAQRILDMVYASGVREVRDTRNGFGLIKRYPFFSDAIELTGEKMVVGQWKGIEQVVRAIESQADGNMTGQSVPVLLGVPGTGKSHIMLLFREALRRGTLREPRFRAFTFEWTNLHEIPELVSVLPESIVNPKNPKPMKDLINDSPFTLLPESIQEAVLQTSGSKVMERISRSPTPKRELNPWSTYIRTAILAHYTKELGRDLTNSEIVEKLDHHVKIRRLLLGDDQTAPIIPYTGREPDLPGIFVGANAPIKLVEGSQHPLAYFPGIIPSANGGPVYFDELLKNEASFVSNLLNMFSSHIVNYGGAAPIRIDSFFMGASNTKDRDKVDERDPDSPLLDRSGDIPWNLLIMPEDIGRVLTMEIKNLKMRPLGTGKKEAYRAAEGKTLFEIFPERQAFEPVLTPHARFALEVGNPGGSSVHISPHSLEFMTYLVSLSRMNFDRNAVRFGNKFPMVKENNAIFADPATRLSVLLGQSDMTPAQLEELHRVSIVSDEGAFGISHRDTERWWEALMLEATKSSNRNTITPILLYETLISSIQNNVVLKNDMEKQETAIVLAKIVMDRFIVPAIREDLNLAVARSEGREALDTMYDEVMQEISAIHDHRDASTYVWPATNERRQINRARLEEINKIYQEKAGRPLSIGEIATWQYQFQLGQKDPAQNKKRNPVLMKAIAEYQTRKTLEKESMTLPRLLDVAAGQVPEANARERERASELMSVLEAELGYNLVAAQRALHMIQSYDANRNQQQQPPQQ